MCRSGDKNIGCMKVYHMTGLTYNIYQDELTEDANKSHVRKPPNGEAGCDHAEEE